MDVNPLLPAGFDLGWAIAWGVIGVAYVGLFLSAIWTIMSSRRLSGSGRLLWVLVLLAFPFLGPTAWFLWGRSARLDRDVL